MRCSRCGFENAAANKFCGECASPLPSQCAKCGADNPPNHKFCGQCGASLTSSPAQPARLPDRPPQSSGLSIADDAPSLDALDGERKTVTALFADIKGSMELMEDLDPEEARRLVDPALALMIDAVHRYDGYIVQSTGDGIFALFGAPIAREDHPQRALYAALRMQEEMRRYSARLRESGNLPVEARVGVNTGEVVVRSIRTDAAHSEYTPIGHSTSLAARMQALAPTGSIAATDQTRKLCEGYFIFKPLGPARIKGVSDPVNVYEVTGAGPLRTRLEVSARRGLSKFVGRKAELDAMDRALELARAGHGQIVAAVGEAGVGKSRLFYEFKATSQSGCLALETFSVSHGKASSFLPLIELLKNYFEMAPADDERKRREKVTGKVLALDRSLEDTLPYLFALLGITDLGAAGATALAGMDPEVHRKRTFESLKRLILRESLNQPLLLVLEDLHWIDGETQAFLDLLVDGIANARLLLLVNYRPEYRHNWGSRSCYTQLRLDPLGKETANEMLSALLGKPAPSTAESPAGAARAGGAASLAALKQFVVEKTQGNPFFMEEMVQALFDQGALVRNGAVRAAKPLADVRIPATVQGILASRIDRLEPREKGLLQTLSVIGKEFPLSLIMRVESRPEEELKRSLSALQLSEFIYEQPAFPDIEYTFKHALTLEVAYNSILTERRKLLHELIASAIEAQFAGRFGDHLDELARHYRGAGNLKKALYFLGIAATEDTQRSAYGEAVKHADSALSILSEMPQSAERDRFELRLLVTKGISLMATKGFWSDETERVFARGNELSKTLDEPLFRFAVLQGLWAFNFTRGKAQQALDIARELLALAERFNEPAMLKDAHHSMASALLLGGRLAAVREHLEKALAQGGTAGSFARPAFYGPDQNVLCLSRLAEALFELGYPDQALKRAYEAMALFDKKTNPFSLCMAMLGACQVLLMRRDVAKGEEIAHGMVALGEENGYPFLTSVGNRMVAWAYLQQDRNREAIAIIEDSLRRLDGGEAAMASYQVLLNLAEAYGQAGEIERALDITKQWHAVRVRLGLAGSESFYYRLRGCLLSKAGNYDAAEKELRESIAVAVGQGANSSQLRTTLCLSRLLRERGRREEARAALAEIYGWFTEGFDTQDLKDAKSLLEKL